MVQNVRIWFCGLMAQLKAMILGLLGICSKMVAQSVDSETGQESFLGSTSSCPLGPNSKRRKYKPSFIPHSIKLSSGAQMGDPPTPDSTPKLHDPWADFKYVLCTDVVCLFTCHDHFKIAMKCCTFSLIHSVLFSVLFLLCECAICVFQGMGGIFSIMGLVMQHKVMCKQTIKCHVM